MQQSIRQQKQQYLRINILERNYDAEQFAQFCENFKGSVDLDSWTLQQLAQIVQQFIKTQKQQHPADQFDFIPSFSGLGGSVGEIPSNISNQFNNWPSFQQQNEQVNKSLDLNLIDLDFLEALGSPSSATKPMQKTFNNKNISIKTQSISKPNVMIVPHDIARKLQQGNQNFIVGYNNNNHTKNLNPYNKEIQYKQKQQQIKKQQSPTRPMKINYSSSVADNEGFQTQIQCKKIGSQSKFIGNQQIVVNGHQIVNPNPLIPNYVLYTITINPLNVEIKRRMKQIQLGRNILKKLFPTTQIPYLQRFSRLSQTQPAIIKKQKMFIESFFNNLLMNKELHCKFLQDFLLIKDSQILKKVFKQYDKYDKPKSIETLWTKQGKVKLKLKQSNKKFIQQSNIYLQYIQNSNSKLKILYDQLINGLVENSKILSEIALVYENLRENSKTLNTAYAPEYRALNLQKSFQAISQLTKQWSVSFKTHAKIVQSQIRHHCKFEQVIKINDSVSEAYCKRSDKDQSDKDSYLSKKLSDYKNGLESPSKNITVLKYQYAYMEQKTTDEIKRFLGDLSIKLNNKFNLFSMLQLNINHDMDIIWKDFQRSATFVE